jgi:hypothetical protein
MGERREGQADLWDLQVIMGACGAGRDESRRWYALGTNKLGEKQIWAYLPLLLHSKRSRGEAAHTIGGYAQGWVSVEEAAVRW